MTLPQNGALVATIILVAGIVLQVLLAVGLPLGHAAWGGRYHVFPMKLRWGSAAATLVLGAAVWTILARANLISPGAQSIVVRVASWIFAGVFVLNTFGNLGSNSRTERRVMTPVTLLLVLCFLAAALSR